MTAPTSGFRRGLITLIALLLVVSHVQPALATTDTSATPDPSTWPSSPVSNPGLETWPNSIRIWGADRYQTSLAAVLTLRSSGGYPYESPDPGFQKVGELESRPAWVGAGRCPRSIIIVAGDSPADALTATSLSDSTGYSSEPYLRRVAAADPLFDPIGGYKRVDTDFAPVILTDSTRNGAHELSPTALLAAKDLRSGGCATARDAIIVGGWSAVPVEAEQQLLGSGYDSIFRVFGKNRFATAAAVSTAMGTRNAPEGINACFDADLEDGIVESAFYANSVVEWRNSPASCELLEKTVVLADGISGVDALAAGWWTSYWQVPVLLHDGSESLPADTALALQALDIKNVIVLGGVARISPAVFAEVEKLVGRAPRRIAGENRYETSVAMARYLGGWWTGGVAGVASGSTLCIVGSSGHSGGGSGWPDALTAGAWCAANSWAASGTGAPKRLLTPANGLAPQWTDPQRTPARGTSPIILVNPASKTLPAAVRVLLRDSFDPGALWCSSRGAPLGCKEPGFSVVFGGLASVQPELVDEISVILGGGPALWGGDPDLVQNRVFITSLDMSGLFYEGDTDTAKLCGLRDAFTHARWLAIGSNTNLASENLRYVDLVENNWYLRDVDDQTRSLGVSSPGCIELDPSWQDSLMTAAVGLDGRRSSLAVADVSASARYELDSAFQVSNPQFGEGVASHVNAISGETNLTFAVPAANGATARFGNRSAPITSASLTLSFRRSGQANRFDGSWNLTSGYGSAIGQVSGEAVMTMKSWEFRGRSVVTGGSWPLFTGSGGFTGSLNFNSESVADDVLKWNIDGFASISD